MMLMMVTMTTTTVAVNGNLQLAEAIWVAVLVGRAVLLFPEQRYVVLNERDVVQREKSIDELEQARLGDETILEIRLEAVILCFHATAQQHNSTTAQQHNSTTAQQHNSTTAQQHNSTTAQQHNSTTAQQDVCALERDKKTGKIEMCDINAGGRVPSSVSLRAISL